MYKPILIILCVCPYHKTYLLNIFSYYLFIPINCLLIWNYKSFVLFFMTL